MMALDDDIARIAALRGRKASDYADAEAFKPKPQRHHLQLAFAMSDNARADTLAFDRLPQASRDFIRESPHPINSRAWEGLLATYREADVIDTARRMQTWPDTRRRPRLSR